MKNYFGTAQAANNAHQPIRRSDPTRVWDGVASQLTSGRFEIAMNGVWKCMPSICVGWGAETPASWSSICSVCCFLHVQSNKIGVKSQRGEGNFFYFNREKELFLSSAASAPLPKVGRPQTKTYIHTHTPHTYIHAPTSPNPSRLLELTNGWMKLSGPMQTRKMGGKRKKTEIQIERTEKKRNDIWNKRNKLQTSWQKNRQKPCSCA